MRYFIHTGASRKTHKLVWVGLVLMGIAFIVCLFAIKTRALEAKARVTYLEHALEQERAEVRIMNAELAHLQNPERLEKLAKTYLKLHPVKAEQTLDLDAAMGKIPKIVAPVDEGEGK